MSEEKNQANEIPHRSDLTQGSIWKHIIRIAYPAIIGQIFNMLYNWTDTFWGGKISTDALAAFSMTFPAFLLAIAVGQGIASGGMVLVSNALGAKKRDDARHYLKHTVLNSVVAGIIIMFLVLFFGKYMLRLLGAEGQVLAYSLQYLNTLAFGMPFLLIYFACNVGLVSQGNTKFMRNVLILNALINVGLDPLLLYGFSLGGITIIPAMGMMGIGLATVFVQILGVVIIWIKIQSDEVIHWRSTETHKVEIPKFDWATSRMIIKFGTPAFLQIAMAALGLFVVNYFMARLSGSYAVAGYGVGLRIEQMALVPSIGIGMALSALIGQNNGAELYLRVRESYFKAIALSGILWIAMMLPVAYFGYEISSIFTTDARALQVSYFYLGFAFIIYMAYQIMSASSGMLQGMKKPVVPIIILTIRQTVFPLVFIPLFVNKLDFGNAYNAIFSSVALSAWISAILLSSIAMIILHKKIKSHQAARTETQV